MTSYSKTEYKKYLNILEVNVTDSLDTIKSAYRKLVAKYHPDKQTDDVAKELANEKLKMVNQAYEYLCKYYDTYSSGQSTDYENYTQEETTYNPNYSYEDYSEEYQEDNYEYNDNNFEDDYDDEYTYDEPYEQENNYNQKTENCSDEFSKYSDESVLLEQHVSISRKKIIQIVIAVILCVSMIIALCFAIIENRNKQTAQYRNINKKDITSLISEENKMEKALKESKNDIVFINFLNTLNNFLISDFESLSVDNLKCKKFCTINGFKLHEDKSWYTFIKPNIGSIYMTYFGEGTLWFKINFEYLKKKYSLYLSDEMNEYMDIRIKQDNDLGHSPLYNDGYLTVEEDVLLQWVLDLQRFINKYPNFALNRNIKKNINQYTSDIVLNQSTFNRQTNILNKKAQKVYQDYINKADKETEEYNFVLKAFHILQKNDFKYSNELSELYQNFINNNIPEKGLYNNL